MDTPRGRACEDEPAQSSPGGRARAGGPAPTGLRTPVPVPAGEVPVLAVGDRAGPPAVLLPGLSDGLAPVSRPEALQLIDAVPVPMRRFHGLVVSYRESLQGHETTRDLAEDVAGVLEQRLTSPAWLLCHSMGAMVAQHLAADRPDLVAGLVLSATLGRADDAFRRVLARWAAQVRQGRWHAFTRDALDTSTTGGTRLQRRALLQVPRPLPAPELVARHLALTRVAATHDALGRLAAIRAPTLVLAGDRDVVCPPHHAVTLARGIPGARLVVLRGLGHGFPEQAPERYAAEVLPRLPGGAVR